MLQLFFKNRCQQKQRRKRKKPEKDESRGPLDQDPAHRELLESFPPIAPAPASDLLHVNSLLEMVKGEEFDGSSSDVQHHVPTSLMNPQALETYTPAAHLASSTTPAQLP